MIEKINPELELALDVGRYSKGSSLYIGYDPLDDSWMLIIRYTGDIGGLIGNVINKCIYLLGGYAIINIYTSNISELMVKPEILYIDKPHFYSYGEQKTGYSQYVSCLTDSFRSQYGLTGEGVCIGVIDSGLNINNPEFYDEDGLRIVSYWNQNEPYTSKHPNMYMTGRIYDRRELETDSGEFRTGEGLSHGNEVTSVAAGTNIGAANGADIIMVEQSASDGIPDTISIMMGIDYLVRYSIDTQTPLVINLSYGSNFGAHDGTAMLELFIDTLSQMAKVSVVTGTGNDGYRQLHTSGLLGNVSFANLDIAVSAGAGSFGLQIWKSYTDNFDVLVYNPAFNIVTYLTEGQTASGTTGAATNVYGIYQSPSPYNSRQLVYIFFQSDTFVEEGVWRIRIVPKSIVNGEYNAYLPSDNFVTGRVAFELSSANGSLTIPATSKSVISVAAYNQNDDSLTGFSGRGYTADNLIKPDMAAPGVGVLAETFDGNYVRCDGTSISAAFVSGCAALLMEWGIVRGNDPFMYGEKLKARLIRGARTIDSLKTYPNRYVGWGAVCIENSIRDIT